MGPLRRLYLHLALVVCLSCILKLTARAEDWPPISPQELNMKEFPQQPGAKAVVLDRDETTDDPHNYRTVYVRLKILTESGRSLADVEIPYSRRAFHV